MIGTAAIGFVYAIAFCLLRRLWPLCVAHALGNYHALFVRSHAEPNQQNVVVLDDVILRLLPQQVMGLDLALAAQTHQVGDGHHFGADEAAGEIGVDAVGRLQRGAALAQAATCGPPARRP